MVRDNGNGVIEPNDLAAAETSIVRAVAPASRSGFQPPRIAFELPVACTPNNGFA
jgi:hypothetical protein